MQPNDGFLFLDHNMNGVVDNDNYKGVRSLDWVDANRDGKIDSVDPTFKELKVTGFEEIQTIVSIAYLLANETLTGFTGSNKCYRKRSCMRRFLKVCGTNRLLKDQKPQVDASLAKYQSLMHLCR